MEWIGKLRPRAFPEVTEQLGGRARTRGTGHGLLRDLSEGVKSDGSHQ